MKNTKFLIALLIFNFQFSILNLHAQRQMEHLDRGVVAINKGSNQMYVGWRLLATDPDTIKFNVYRQIGNAAPVKLNSAPVFNSTNWQGTVSNITLAARYFVRSVYGTAETETEGYWDTPANQPVHRIVKDIDYQPIAGETSAYKMEMKFCWAADLDGDGRYDFIIDRQNYGAATEDEGGSDGDSYLSPKVEAYSADGQFLWRVDMGYNVKICDGHNDMVTAFDMDGDNHSEVLMAVSEGTTFADGQVITAANGTVTDYRNIAGSAPQWLAVVNGRTGNLIDTISLTYFNEIATQRADKWKNISGHFIIAYLDGIHPSLIYQYKNRQNSGGFTGAYDAVRFENGQLVKVWARRFLSESVEYEAHQVRVADVDGDGKDEFVEISYTLDHDGALLYKVPDIGHGDRHCLADIDPDRPGLEQFFIQQTNIVGMGLFDAQNGEMIKPLYLSAVGDVGRGICAAFDSSRRGMQFFSTMSNYAMYDCKGNLTGGTGIFPAEALWFGPDLKRWELRGVDGSGYNLVFEQFSGNGFSRVTPNFYNEKEPYYFRSAYGARAAFWGDILGDWREELVLNRRDGTGFCVVSTSDLTVKRQYCLMQNPAYRCQTTARGYYQTADVDFYMAADMPAPPVAPVQKADTVILTNNLTSAVNGISAMFSLQNTNDTVLINENVNPSLLYLINPKGKNFIFNGNGKITGNTSVIKSQQGDITFNGNHDYTGITRISEGRLFVNGTLESAVVVNARGVIGGSGKLNGGVTFEAGLNVEGGRIEPNDMLIVNGNIVFLGRNNIAFDINQNAFPKNDFLKINGDFTVNNTNNSLIFTYLTELQPDTLTLIEFTGATNATAANFRVKGLDGIPYQLLFEANRIRLVIQEARNATTVKWNGAYSSVWDYQTKNFTFNNTETVFVPNDTVIFDDTAITKTVTFNEIMPAGNITVNTESTYTFGGTGGIGGAATLKKEGAGTLKISNTANNFTGAVQILGGTVEAVSLANSGAESSIGAGNSLQISNATLKITGQAASNRNVSLSGNVTFTLPSTSASLMLAANIAGNTADAVKDGAGTLNLQGVNTFKTVKILTGTLALGSVNANKTSLGSAKITMEGGTLQMYDNNESGNVQAFANEIIVPEGKTATWNQPRRWNFTNKISGAGTLTINAPYVRGDQNVDWSGFSGKINFTGKDIRLNSASARNLSNAEVNLGSGTTLYCATNGSGTLSATQNLAFRKFTMAESATLIRKLNLPMSANDIINLQNAVLNGTLNINSSSVNYSAGQEFKIFNATGSITGTFTQITPALPDGLRWDLSRISEGIIKIASITDAETTSASSLKIKSIEYFDILGRKISENEKGIVIQKIIYDDGSIAINKKVVHLQKF